MHININNYTIEDTMTHELWARTVYFKNYMGENWGDPMKMKVHLIYWLDWYRAMSGRPFIVHCGYEERDKGYHPRGMAVDGHSVGMTWMQQFTLATRIPHFNGVGVYPYWNNPGLHLDVRVFHNLRNFWWRDEWITDDGKLRHEYHNITSIEQLMVIP